MEEPQRTQQLDSSLFVPCFPSLPHFFSPSPHPHTLPHSLTPSQPSAHWVIMSVKDHAIHVSIPIQGLPVSVPFPFQVVLRMLLASLLSGLLLSATPTLASLVQSPLTSDGLFVSLAAMTGVSLVLPLLLR